MDTYVYIYIHTYIYLYINVSIRTLLTAGSCAGGGLFGDRREMPGIRIGMAGNDGSWFATFRLGLGRRFASCDLYTRYIPATTTRPPILWDSTWRMWLPDERKQSSKIYRSYLPTDAGYLSSYQRIPSIGSSKFILPAFYYSSLLLIPEKYSVYISPRNGIAYCWRRLIEKKKKKIRENVSIGRYYL